MRILLIEHDADTAIKLAIWCQSRDHRVDVTSALPEARHMLMENDRYNLILCESAIVNGNAAQMVELANSVGAVSVHISDVCTRDSIEASRRAGFRACLCKPLSEEAFASLLTKLDQSAP
jgi:formylmethanofuran dehydrogenase subunit B